jgi:hypothetical protein
MNKTLLIIIGAVALLAIGLLIHTGIQSFKLNKIKDQLNEELMQANEKLGRAETEFGDANKYIKELEKEIQREIKEREGVIEQYAVLRAKYKVLQKGKGKHSKTEFGEDTVFEDLIPGGIYRLREDGKTFQFVAAVAGFYRDERILSEWQGRPIKNGWDWDFRYELQVGFELEFVESHLPSGAVNHYATLWEINPNGTRLGKLEIDEFRVVINKPDKDQMFWWAPHLDIAALGMMKLNPPGFSTGASLGVSFAGAGRTKNDLKYRFLRLSLDISDDSTGVGLTPGLYNLGEVLPLLSNFWIGPHVHWGLAGERKVGLLLGGVL